MGHVQHPEKGEQHFQSGACLEREAVYNRTALVISDPVPESPQPMAGRGVPHKLRGETKLGVGFGAQLLLHKQKGCAQNMAQSLSDQKLEMCLCSLNSSFSEPPRDL